jgi:adenosylcobinamide-phosphate synthase
MLFSCSVLLCSLALDYKFSEVSRHHPLVYFGNLALYVERKLNLTQSAAKVPDFSVYLLGICAWILVVLPITYLSYVIQQSLTSQGFVGGFATVIYASIVLYVALGWRSLLEHAIAVTKPLKAHDIEGARKALSMIVSRETAQLDEYQISNAATESVLENGGDAIFCAIFWFMILGVPGVVLYRLSNTLDAMWGYKNSRYFYFGWAAARIDDILNYFPARLCALSYALLGNTRSALHCWKAQGVNWKSPNAGPVMAAGAGAINVRIGGGSVYHGQYQERPVLGPEQGEQATCISVDAACFLVNRTLALWVVVLLTLAVWGY